MRHLIAPQPSLAIAFRQCGTTAYGGAGNNGTVFKLDSNGRETVLFSFEFLSMPAGRLILDSTGNLYGADSISGSVYKLDTAGHQAVLYNFTGHADGGSPNGVISDAAGNLYGTAGSGGSQDRGLVFKLTLQE